MAFIHPTYGSAQFLRVISVEYDDVSHVVNGGSYDIGSTPIPSGLTAGSEFYRQEVGTDYWSIRVQNTYPYAYVVQGSTAIACDLSIGDVVVVAAMNGVNGSITVPASGTGTKRYDIGGARQAGNVFNNVLPGPYVLRLSRTEDLCEVTVNVTVPGYPDLSFNATAVNVTANGLNDGILAVLSIDGSNDYTAQFKKNGATFLTVPLSFSFIPYAIPALGPGLYRITITDDVTGQVRLTELIITEPVVVPPPPTEDPTSYLGTVLNIPYINSVHFVDRGLDQTEQGLDNKLLCEQSYGRYIGQNYAQKFNIADKPKTQFFSNFENHLLQLFTKAGVLVKNFSIDLKVDNLTTLIAYAITLTEHGAGQSRVYFASQELPLLLSVGSTFTIEDNPDGLDGDYAIIDIQIDNDGFQYLVINADFSAVVGDESIANGLFKNSLQYNVYECEHSFVGVNPGKYYMVLTGSVGVNSRVWQSEPMNLQVLHKDCNAIVYSNIDNAFGVEWTTGYKGLLRVPSFFGHKRIPGGERTLSRNSNYSLVKVSAKKQRLTQFEMFGLPPYLIEKLSVIFDLDAFAINSVACQSSDGLDKPQFLDYTLRSNVNVLVEQLNWFNTYNSDDIMGTSSSGQGCLCDELDLVPVGTTNATITLNMNNKRQRVFRGAPVIDANRQVALSNDSVGLSFRFIFDVTGNREFTFPANSVSQNVPDFDSATKKWTNPDPGKYTVEGVWDGTNWNLSFSRAFS